MMNNRRHNRHISQLEYWQNQLGKGNWSDSYVQQQIAWYQQAVRMLTGKTQPIWPLEIAERAHIPTTPIPAVKLPNRLTMKQLEAL